MSGMEVVFDSLIVWRVLIVRFFCSVSTNLWAHTDTIHANGSRYDAEYSADLVTLIMRILISYRYPAMRTWL